MGEKGRPADGWAWERVLHGIIPPLISPLGDPGDPDAGAMAALVDQVFAGGCSGLLVLGGCGAFQRLLAIKREAPSLFGDLQVAADRGVAATRAALQARIAALAGLHRQRPFVSALKAACEMLGLGNGRPAPALLPATPGERAAIRALLEAAGLALAASVVQAR